MQGRIVGTIGARYAGLALLAGAVFAVGAIGCVSVKAPERIHVEGRHQPVDASQVPPTSSHEEARQRLAEAYGEIRYLQAKVADLEEDKAELRRERKRDDD